MKLKVFYWNGKNNAGDYFSKWLLEKMGIEAEYSKESPDITVSGSILNCSPIPKSKVWGLGFHNEDEKRVLDKNKIYAVRGKLTEKNLGFNVPAKGDPGILASKFHKGCDKKKYKYGIVSHYIDMPFFKSIKLPDNATLINMETTDVDFVLDRISECEFILSSSLHGIIFANSYEIPAIRIKHNELATRNAFKFRDYYSVFSSKFIEKDIKKESDLDWAFFDSLFEHKELYVPTHEEIIKCQKDLLSAFPYKCEYNMKTAICAIAKNENLYINDWVEYHIKLGFDKIFLFDNNDSDSEYVGNFISQEYKNKVEIIPVNDVKHFQKRAYNDYYCKFGVNYDWTAIIDIDEFIVLQKHKNIKSFLMSINKNIQSIRLNWQIYGDDYGKASSDVKIPVYKRITEKLNHKYNMNGKCIIKGGQKNVIFDSVHYPTIDNKMPVQCLPSGEMLNDDSKINIGKIEYSVAYIAHYMTKTWDEFKVQKLNRSDAALSRTLTEDYFYIVNKR